MLTRRYLSHALTKSPLRIPLMWWRHRAFLPEDVFVASYPRSGSTWLRFLLYEILSGQSADFPLVRPGIPMVGEHARAERLLPGNGRLIKTHEQFRPEYRRAIFMYRDPRDVAPSEYSFNLGTGVFVGDFERFFDGFLRGTVNGFGSWASHTLSWLDAVEARRTQAVVIRFEDMRRDPHAAVTRVMDFLGVSVTPEQIGLAIEHNSAAAMRAKEERLKDSLFRNWGQGQRFIRQGAVGGGKEALSPGQLERLEAAFRPALERASYPLTSR